MVQTPLVEVVRKSVAYKCLSHRGHQRDPPVQVDCCSSIQHQAPLNNQECVSKLVCIERGSQSAASTYLLETGNVKPCNTAAPEISAMKALDPSIHHPSDQRAHHRHRRRSSRQKTLHRHLHFPPQHRRQHPWSRTSGRNLR